MISAITAIAKTSENDTVIARQAREIFEFEKLLAKVRIGPFLTNKRITIFKLKEQETYFSVFHSSVRWF
jgi:hypothetical protein